MAPNWGGCVMILLALVFSIWSHSHFLFHQTTDLSLPLLFLLLFSLSLSSFPFSLLSFSPPSFSFLFPSFPFSFFLFSHFSSPLFSPVFFLFSVLFGMLIHEQSTCVLLQLSATKTLFSHCFHCLSLLCFVFVRILV